MGAEYLGFREALNSGQPLVGNGRWLGAVAAVFIAAYLAELAAPTFSMDFFYDNDLIGQPYYAFYSDGRYAPILLRYFTGNLFPPTLLLLVGLFVLALCGLLTCVAFGVRDRATAFVVCSIFGTFPFLLEILAYHPLRHQVPIAVLLSIFATVCGGIYRDWRPTLIGVAATFASLNFYQSMIGVGIVLTVFLTALRILKGGGIKAALLRFALPRALVVIVSLLLYSLFVRVIEPFMVMPAVRYSEHAQFVSTPGEFASNAKAIALALWEALSANVLLFPAALKWLFLALCGMLAIVTVRHGLTMRRPVDAGFAVALMVGSPLLVFGVLWGVYPAQGLMFDRVLFPLVAVYAGVFLSLAVLSPATTKPVAAIGAVIVAGFVVQANIWHQYLDLKNRADIDVASKISHQVVTNENFRPGLPLVIVGTTSLSNYLPFRVFPTGRERIRNSIFPSVFAQKDVNYRTLQFFFQYNGPTPEALERAKQLASDMPAWPAAESVDIREDKIIVVLSK